MTREEIKFLIKSDLLRAGGGSILKKCILGTNTSLRFLFWLRMSKLDGVIGMLARLQRIRLTRRFGVQISDKCQIGCGLDLPHCLPLVIHPNTVIGRNCTIHQFVTIAGVDGKAPHIGDNVYIASGACLVGDIVIGNNVTIGANAVCTRNIPDNATVGGVPARVIHCNHPGKYIKNPVNETF